MIETPRERLDDAVGGNHQGVVAQAAEYPTSTSTNCWLRPDTGDRLYLALDHLQDVQNLGTLLRTAEAMGVTGVILPGRRSAGGDAGGGQRVVGRGRAPRRLRSSATSCRRSRC